MSNNEINIILAHVDYFHLVIPILIILLEVYMPLIFL